MKLSSFIRDKAFPGFWVMDFFISGDFLPFSSDSTNPFPFSRILVHFRQIWNRWPHGSGIEFSKTEVAMQNPEMSLEMVSGFSF